MVTTLIANAAPLWSPVIRAADQTPTGISPSAVCSRAVSFPGRVTGPSLAGARQWHRRWPTDTGERAGSRLRWGTAHQPWAGPQRLNDTWSWADLLGGRAPRLVRSHSRSLTAHPLRACPVCGRVMTSSRTVPSTARHPAPRDTHAPRPTDQAYDAHRACVRAPLGPAQTQPERPPAVPCPRLPPRQTWQ